MKREGAFKDMVIALEVACRDGKLACYMHINDSKIDEINKNKNLVGAYKKLFTDVYEFQGIMNYFLHKEGIIDELVKLPEDKEQKRVFRELVKERCHEFISRYDTLEGDDGLGKDRTFTKDMIKKKR